MKITPTLIRWSRASNRRRGLELAVLGLPWLAAGAALAFAGWRAYGGGQAALVAGIWLIFLAVMALRQRKAIWRNPMTTAHAVDQAHGTSDLLASAAAIEAGTRRDAPLAPVVLERARAILPSLEATAVPPLRLRLDTGGALSALAAVAIVFLIGATGHRAGAHADEAEAKREAIAAPIEEEELKKLVELAQQIARNKQASAEAREAAAKAAEALAKASKAKTAAGALGELSEAARAMDRASRALGQKKAPTPADLAKMDTSKLAQQLADAARNADSAKLAALAREALRRASADPAAAQQLAEALAKAAAAQKAAGTSGDPSMEQRLNKLAAAAARMSAGDNDGARSDLAALDRLSKTGASPSDEMQAQLDAARQQLGAMRDAQRGALNADSDAARAARAAMASGAQPPPGTGDQDLRAAAARAQAGTGAKPGASPMPGAARTPGAGRMPGAGQMTPSGAPPGGMPSNGPGTPSPHDAPPGPATNGPDQVVSVRMGSGHAGHGPTGPKKPSGAGEPSSFSVEQVETAPAVTPEGAVRAIAERTSGLHQPTALGPVLQKYDEINEKQIRSDDIPLTRRDYIQRYFAALRTHEEP